MDLLYLFFLETAIRLAILDAHNRCSSLSSVLVAACVFRRSERPSSLEAFVCSWCGRDPLGLISRLNVPHGEAKRLFFIVCLKSIAVGTELLNLTRCGGICPFFPIPAQQHQQSLLLA